LQTDLGISNIATTFVSHCYSSFGIVFASDTWGRVLYSGDCRPSQKLADCANEVFGGVDICIHEATFEDNLMSEAVLKKHATIKEAIALGQSVSAEYVILTHFSQRYAKLPNLNLSTSSNPPFTVCNEDGEELETIAKNELNGTKLIVAWDFMRLQKCSLSKASCINDRMQLLFPPVAEMENSPETKKANAEVQKIMNLPGAFANNNFQCK